ncbi:uncharacterized protein LOC116769783 [Danaus plexippus]|uniref:uncharacterized protein LOC116769783 n=1 Tax=Danaus plexippus TaxID=13037 RepID=UPI002AB1DC11|nr:uncharacterized protein LOC116769783 [Danaus plexippus]
MSKTTFVSVLFLCVFSAGAQSSLQTVDGKIHIHVGLTSGCRDARGFMSQIRQTYDLYKDHIEIQFVPWARTIRDGNGNLICQFGEQDCFANRVFRCSLILLKEKPDAQVDYMACEMSSPFPAFSDQSLRCVKNVGLDLDEVNNCLAVNGDKLEVEAEKLAAKPMAAINFVPYIVFNNVIDRDMSFRAFFNLENLVCSALRDDPSTGVKNCKL